VAVQVSYPGVYIDEFAPGAPIQGVGTGTASFIGVASAGDLDTLRRYAHIRATAARMLAEGLRRNDRHLIEQAIDMAQRAPQTARGFASDAPQTARGARPEAPAKGGSAGQ